MIFKKTKTIYFIGDRFIIEKKCYYLGSYIFMIFDYVSANKTDYFYESV